MKNAQILKLYDLIQEIKKTDDLIRIHQNLADDAFVVDQYLALKDNLFAQLISDLAKPQFASAVSYQFVQALIERFYSNEPSKVASSPLTAELIELRNTTLSAA